MYKVLIFVEALGRVNEALKRSMPYIKESSITLIRMYRKIVKKLKSAYT